ncbi:MAG: hypothetical protein ACLSXF_06455 [Clostridium sp.]
MAVYKIKSSEITATATNTIISQNVTLETETLELITGQVLDTNGTTPVEGAAVVLYKKLTAEPQTITKEAIAYTVLMVNIDSLMILILILILIV